MCIRDRYKDIRKIMRVEAGAGSRNTNLGTVDHFPIVFCIFCDILPMHSCSQRNNSIFYAASKTQQYILVSRNKSILITEKIYRLQSVSSGEMPLLNQKIGHTYPHTTVKLNDQYIVEAYKNHKNTSIWPKSWSMGSVYTIHQSCQIWHVRVGLSCTLACLIST